MTKLAILCPFGGQKLQVAVPGHLDHVRSGRINPTPEVVMGIHQLLAKGVRHLKRLSLGGFEQTGGVRGSGVLVLAIRARAVLRGGAERGQQAKQQ